MPVDSSKPAVSVILSTFNRAATLGRAIDSVLGQDFASLELIVIDDACDEATPRVLESYAGEARLKSHYNEVNRGLQASLNTGIDLAQGEFLARIDDDDWWSDAAKLSRQVAYMQANADCGLLGTAYIDEQGKPCRNPLTDHEIRRQMLFRCPFCHASVLMRSAALQAVGHYDEGLAYAEDWDLWMRIGQRWQLANLPDICVQREQGEHTLSERYFSRQSDIATLLRRRHGSGYPRRLTAGMYHAAVSQFFRWFPVGGKAHRFMGGLFGKAFGLHRR